MDINLLINLGAGPDGDKGSSGMQPGMHVFIKPPPINIIGVFIEIVIKTLTKVLKVGNFPVPKMPTLGGIQMGFTIGETIGFKFQISKIFSISCVVKTKGGMAISCKLGLDFLSIFIDAGKWIAKMGKKLFDAAGKAFMSVASALGDFVSDIANGAKKIFSDLKQVCKKALIFAKQQLKKLKETTRKLLNKAKQIHDKAIQVFNKVGKKIKNAFDNIGRKLNGFINKLGKDIANLAKKIFNSVFHPQKYKRQKMEKEAAKKKLEEQKEKEEEEEENKIKKEENEEGVEREENFANVEVENAQVDEVSGEKEQWKKELEYQDIKQKLKEI